VKSGPKILLLADRVLAVALVALLLGSTLCFGGAVWWFRPAAALLAFLLAGAKLGQFLIQGEIPCLKSPLTLFGLLALALGMLQLAPLPPTLARRLSSSAQEIYAHGALPRLVRADEPGRSLDEPAQIRSPATLDRAATLHWLGGAAVCLAVFWTVSHFADRLSRLFLVWGCVLAGCLINGAFGVVQLTCGSDGLFGVLHPGRGPIWAPSFDDLLTTPTTVFLRRLDDSPATPSSGLERIALVPEEPRLFGTMMSSHGAFLALASLALPLGLSVLLHLVSPRGSSESLRARLRQTRQGSLVALVTILLAISAGLVGSMAGSWFSVPFGLGLAVVGLPSVMSAPSRWPAIFLTSSLLLALGLGATLVVAWPVIAGRQAPIEPVALDSLQLLWTQCLPTLREFPWVGTGLGSFGTIYPYMKTQNASSTTALSSLLQYGLESGAVGLALVALAILWSLWRLPICLKRVGSADRALAHGLIGAALSFSLWFSLHWTVELPAVAISVSALGGTWNHWLSGGTDLFVERG
jgi:hypothetical protein